MALILIAEDDPLLTKLLVYRLERAGHSVLAATDGSVALTLAREKRPALIVLDAMMPGFDGFEVLRQLKEDESTRAIPVMMLTARKEEKDIVGALSRGARDYLVKPFMPEEFLARVRLILGSPAA